MFVIRHRSPTFTSTTDPEISIELTLPILTENLTGNILSVLELVPSTYDQAPTHPSGHVVRQKLCHLQPVTVSAAELSTPAKGSAIIAAVMMKLNT